MTNALSMQCSLIYDSNQMCADNSSHDDQYPAGPKCAQTPVDKHTANHASLTIGKSSIVGCAFLMCIYFPLHVILKVLVHQINLSLVQTSVCFFFYFIFLSAKKVK